jgi:hypothetical protein
VRAAESQAESARTEAAREHAQLIELEARLIEMEHRLATQARVCNAPPDAELVQPAVLREQPKAKPLRSEGDFLVEAHTVAPGAGIPAGTVAAAGPATPTSERERVEQLLNGLREYGTDTRSGLSVERREALRVLLRRERPLDLMNPWDGH